jgi:undecaprenyl-diphosphatase
MAPLDTVVFRVLNWNAANPVCDRIFPFLTSLHQQAWFAGLLAVMAVLTLWRGGRRGRVWVAALVIAVSVSDVLCSKVVKRVVTRDRPCQAATRSVVGSHGGHARVVDPERCPGSPSFPSNHASNTMAAGIVCWWLTRRRWRWAWFLLPLALGYTRIYLGYHYPTDVLAGWAVGAAVAATVLGGGRWGLYRSTRRSAGTARIVSGASPPA